MRENPRPRERDRESEKEEEMEWKIVRGERKKKRESVKNVN